MKAVIMMDPASKAGILKVIPENSGEAYALYHWYTNFNQGKHDSIFNICEFVCESAAQDENTTLEALDD